MKSIHRPRRYVTRPEHIKIWDKSFELDNFSPKEIATALGIMAQGKIRFSCQEISICIRNKGNPNKALKELTKEKPVELFHIENWRKSLLMKC